MKTDARCADRGGGAVLALSWLRRSMRRASCARPTSTSSRGFRPSIRPSRRGSIPISPAATSVTSIDRPHVSRPPTMHAVPSRGNPTRRCPMRAIRRTSIRPATAPIAAATANAVDRPSPAMAARQDGAAKKGNGGRATTRRRPRAQPAQRSQRARGRDRRRADRGAGRGTGAAPWPDAVESQNFPLIGATIGLFRITDRRPADDRAP